MIPTPLPAPLPSGADVDWTDIVSALSDAIVAFGSVITLILIVMTVRQQGKALGLQIQQLEQERKIRETERARVEQETRQQRQIQVRRVHISSDELQYDSASPYGIEAFSTVGGLLSKERKRPGAGRHVWQAAIITVKNGSDMVIRNLSFRAENMERPDYIYPSGATELLKTYELGHLAPSRQATFIWMDRVEKALHSAKAELYFSDEDGHRWAADLRGNTVRVDQVE